MLTRQHQKLVDDCLLFAREVRSVLSENQLTLYGQIFATVAILALAWTARADGTAATYIIGAIWTVRIPEIAEAWLRVRVERRKQETAERQRAPMKQQRGE